MKKAATIEEIVKNVIKKMSGGSRPGKEEIEKMWGEAAGEAATKHSRPVSLKRSVLVVNVDGSSWLYELTTKKRDIIKKLGLGSPGRSIKDIRFRIGEVK
ncbi:MAG: DUF721 domain-containing protein [Candidatus Omnitrophota bacterium]|jgi:predicted nucleic acid-binding Zn ribbon protein